MYLLLTCLSPQYDYIPKTLGGGGRRARSTIGGHICLQLLLHSHSFTCIQSDKQLVLKK